MIVQAWWRRLSPRDVRALRIAAMVVVPAVAYAVVVRPVTTSITELRARVERERDLYRREAGLVAQGPTLEAALVGATKALRRASVRFFVGQDSVTSAAGLVAYVTELAAATGVVVQGSEPSVSSARDGVLRLRVEVRAVSDLLGLADWLDELEQGEKLVRVAQLSVLPSVQIGSPADAGAMLGLTVVVEGFALLKPEPATESAGGKGS